MNKPSAFAFRYDDHSILTLDSIGRQVIATPAYSFAGEERPDAGHVIFQYTLSGQGYIDIDHRRYPLPPGTGFLVKVPGRHRYYYLEADEPWEILWINLRGEEAVRIWDLVTAREGPIIRRGTDAPLIAHLLSLLGTIAEEKATDKYRLSGLVYEWLLTLVQSSREPGKEVGASSVTIMDKAKKLIREQYAAPLTLDAIAGHCGVNRHYLCRLFQKSERTSPLAYLRDRRVEAALALLRTTEMPVQEIGRRCGFDSPSYFGKVFRAYMDMTPGEYRAKNLEFPYDAVYYG
ncbi:helix-turn-helix transcriptional regulator [Cohnella sp. JJ-181]|uniref:helix-turn-helix transcriptional regulator n=1 Tax=Cohnella rhizoplanae TaxID=2974897 RepID=UPI0022FF7311|nr:AraC family transcriptional regulator [Cohnella sp. JJ-181]CAI6083198.1 HTH-type transcriptional activator RhaR [Cohnella sp. JJ-181]